MLNNIVSKFGLINKLILFNNLLILFNDLLMYRVESTLYIDQIR